MSNCGCGIPGCISCDPNPTKINESLPITRHISKADRLIDSLRMKITKLGGECDKLREALQRNDNLIVNLRKEVVTITEDFNTTWEALMKLEGKFTLATEALREIYVGGEEFELPYEALIGIANLALTRLDKP